MLGAAALLAGEAAGRGAVLQQLDVAPHSPLAELVVLGVVAASLAPLLQGVPPRSVPAPPPRRPAQCALCSHCALGARLGHCAIGGFFLSGCMMTPPPLLVLVVLAPSRFRCCSFSARPAAAQLSPRAGHSAALPASETPSHKGVAVGHAGMRKPGRSPQLRSWSTGGWQCWGLRGWSLWRAAQSPPCSSLCCWRA